MIQIYGLRPYFDAKKNKQDVKHIHMGSVENVEDTLDPNFVNRFPENERFNIYYTIADCKEGTRVFEKQRYYVIDIDKIDLTKVDAYRKVVPKGGVFTCSGNGVQIIYRLASTIESLDGLKELKNNNKLVCAHVEAKMRGAGLVGECDTSVFKGAGLARVPNTTNRKPIKDPFGADANIKQAVLLDKTIRPGSFDLELVFKCGFLQHCYEDRANLSEDHWYAALDILTYVDKELAHKISSGYSGYTREETDEKLEQASAATSGPRTCADIANRWSGCGNCPFRDKCVTPANLFEDEEVTVEKDRQGTLENGFTYWTGSGKSRRQVRDYDALLDYFIKETNYINIEDREVLYRYTGTHYEPMTKLFAKNFAEKYLLEPVKELERNEFYNKTLANRLKKLSELKTNDGGYINCLNGIVDMKNKKLMPHNPEWFLDSCLDYDYDPTAVAKTWPLLLNNLMLGNANLIQTMNEYGGYCISNDPYTINKIMIMDGEGNNGKTTLANCFRKVFGTHNCSDIEVTSLSKNKFSAASLEGKLVNFCEEEPKSCFSNTGPIKKLTGNTPIAVERKFQNGYSIQNRAKLIMSYNETPFLGDVSGGMKRRLLIIPFPVNLELKPELKIRNVEAKIHAERSGILNIFIDAYLKLMERGDFMYLPESAAKLNQMIEESDEVYSFIAEQIVITKNEEDRESILSCWDFYAKSYETKEDNMSKRRFMKKFKKYMDDIDGVNYKDIKFPAEKGGRTMKGFIGFKLIEEFTIESHRKH